jgi:hypothetical protein
MGSGQFMIFEIRSDGCGYFPQRPTDGCGWVLGWAVLGTQFLLCCWNLMHKLKERKKKKKLNFFFGMIFFFWNEFSLKETKIFFESLMPPII